jgi:hypothetical protein
VGWCKECVKDQKGNIHSFPPSFLHSFLSLPQMRSLGSPNRVVQTALSNVSSFNFRYPLFSSRSSCRFLCLLRRLRVNYNLPILFHAIWCFIRRFLSKMWPIIWHFLLFILCTILLSYFAICNISSFPTQMNKKSFTVHLQHHSSIPSSYLWSTFWSVQCSAP